MTFLFLLGVPLVFMLPLWWLNYSDIMKRTLAFKEEWYMGVFFWLIHAWIPFALYCAFFTPLMSEKIL